MWSLLTGVLLLPGYAPGTPFKMSCSPNTGTVPPFSSSPNPYPAAMYPVRSTYPQQNPYAQVRTSRSSQRSALMAPPLTPLLLLVPGINTLTTTGHLLHTASVCGAASCYPSHDCGPAQRDACRHVCPAYSPHSPQRCCHGDGRWHHHGHVSR